MLSQKEFSQLKYFRYVEKAPVWLTISMIVILAGIICMFINKAQIGNYFNLSIHYTGGDKILLQFKEPVEVDGQNISGIIKKYAKGEPIVQVYVDDPHIVSIKMNVAATGKTEAEQSDSRTENVREMKRELGNAYGGYSDVTENLNPVTLEQDYVGPTVGQELINNAILALLIGCVLIMVYILWRFNRWQMSVAGIVALVHDVLVTLGVAAILRLEVSDSFIAVILTIIGYSINDTIIIFDRVRENYRTYGDNVPFVQLCNLSLNQTVVRSINTVITVIIMIATLLVLGGENIRDFLIAMLIGMISGGYSSIFVATPLMIWMDRGNKSSLATEAAVIAATPAVDLTAVPEMEGETQVARERARRAAEEETQKAKKQQRRR
jgi:preprotein translocase subunit SecF